MPGYQVLCSGQPCAAGVEDVLNPGSPISATVTVILFLGCTRAFPSKPGAIASLWDPDPHLTSMLGSTSSQPLPGLAGVVQEGSKLVIAWSVQNRDSCRGEPGIANHARPGRLEVPPSTLVRWVNVPTAGKSAELRRKSSRHKSEMIGSRSVFIAEMTCSSPIVGRRLRCAAVYSSSWLLS